jgi:hypothetical protein
MPPFASTPGRAGRARELASSASAASAVGVAESQPPAGPPAGGSGRPRREFKPRTSVRELLRTENGAAVHEGEAVELRGWVRTVRGQKAVAFLQARRRRCAAALRLPPRPPRNWGGRGAIGAALPPFSPLFARGSPPATRRWRRRLTPPPRPLPPLRPPKPPQLNDGSNVSGIQVVLDAGVPGFELIESGVVTTGAAVIARGTLISSKGDKQAVEVKGTGLELVGPCSGDCYPLQKKRHSLEFLRSIAHLRPRTNTIGAVARVRSALAAATHAFFTRAGFHYVHTPLLSAADCEGAGEMFQARRARAGFAFWGGGLVGGRR